MVSTCYMQSPSAAPVALEKTQLALYYVEKHTSRYPTQIYLDGETDASLIKSFDQAALRFSLSSTDSMNAVKDFLRAKTWSGDSWLVILDNANNLSSPLHQYIPQGPRGTVILLVQIHKAMSSCLPQHPGCMLTALKSERASRCSNNSLNLLVTLSRRLRPPLLS